MSSVAMCREKQMCREPKTPMPAPVRFERRKPKESWKDYKGETLTHRDHALLPRNREDGVVAPWSPRRGVDEEMDLLICDWGRGCLREHDIQVDRAEDLLEGVEGEPTQFALDEVGAVLHDRLQLDVPVPALPPRDEVQHVGTLCRPTVLPAGVAGESDGECGEEREVGGLVPHAEEAREEVDLGCDSGDGQQACRPHDEEGEYCLVGKI